MEKEGKTRTQCIIELIKVLGRPHKILILPIIIDGEQWDGIRLFGSGYELFQIDEIPEKDRKDFGGAESMEYVFGNELLEEKDERLIQAILEQILLES